jgi:hypothetical protein
MKILRLWFALFALLMGVRAHAEDQVISVPGEGWRIHFESPKLAPLGSTSRSLFLGRADRLQVSFFVEPPRCVGGDSDENIYECFTKSLKTNPVVEWDTERGNTVPNGVLVMYMAKMEIDGRVGRSFNVHLLFARHGKWADLHSSIASPTADDVSRLMALIDSVKIEAEADSHVRANE